MDTSYIYHHLKTKRMFWALCGFSLIAYCALVFFLLRAIFFEPEVSETLSVDTSTVFQKMDGKGLLVNITGSGFDEKVEAYLAYDAGNHGAIVATLPTWGYLRQVVVRGDTAYLANGHRGFLVVDTRNLHQPLIVGSVDTPGPAWAIAIAGSYAYVADGTAGLQVISIDDLHQPRIVATLPIEGDAIDVLVTGDRVVVATRKHGVKIVSVEHPQRPRLVAEIAVEGGGVKRLALDGGKLFVVKGKQGVWEYAFDDTEGYPLVRKLETSGSAQSIEVSEKEILVCCGKNGLDIFPLAGTESKPSFSIDTPGSARAAVVVGGSVYIADNFNGLQVLKRHPGFSWQDAGTVDTPGNAWDVVVDGGYAFVADGKKGLQIVSLDKINPSKGLQRIITPGYVETLAVQENKIYVADGPHGLHVVSCNSNGDFRIVDSFKTPGYAYDVAIKDDRIYVADGAKGLQVLTVKRGGVLQLVDTVKLDGVARAVTVIDRLAVVAAGKTGLYIVDIENIAGPRVIGYLGELGYLRDVAVVGEHAFVAAGKAGLLQVSIKEPTRPRVVGTVTLPLPLQVFAQSLAVTVHGDKMMVANATAGCQIFDVSVPEKPRFLTSIASMDYVKGVSAFEGTGYLYDYKNGVQAVDLKTLQQLRSVASSKLTGLAVVDGKALLGHGNGGVSIVPLPIELSEVDLRSSQELSVFIPNPAMRGRYSLWLTKGEHSMIVPQPLTFDQAGLGAAIE
ncbi:hypothetical protein A7E78_01195 [Syntrophotalea acetylenivorans]|uniref:Uncharacterized protein n=1 Tax=Syntrophotalea acetylenivorans TaxID=1842532 RepID=A0A1L3GKY5_9BACT|nr:hypothetical protein [Syntrophotalea acetylenivorans]APG26596.1 hypothetical protein A7E78_01195 [Syntrophotalea acetylenivorans]